MELKAAYLAGVFDSDGSFSVARRNMKRSSISYVAMVQLSWKKTDIAEMFFIALSAKYGGSYQSCDSTNTAKSYGKTGRYLKFSATGEAAERIARDLVPYLILKKQQAMNLLELRTLVKPGPNRDPEVTARLEELYHFNKSLNHKNGAKNA